MICRQKRTHLNPGSALAIQPVLSTQQTRPPSRRRKPTNPWVMNWIREKKEDFVKMPPAFFTSIRKAFSNWIYTSNNAEIHGWRRKIHICTVSTAGWPNHHMSICPQGLPSHLYFSSPTDPEDSKKVEEKFKSRWNVPHILRAGDRKITMKKPKRSWTECYNYKGFFPLMLLAVVDTEYRFLLGRCWVK